MRLFQIAIQILSLSYSALGHTYTISTVAGGGLPENMPGLSARLRFPAGVAADSAGNVFIADEFIVLKLDSSGILTRVAGNGTNGFGGDNGPAIDARLSYPAGLALDSSGSLYIADSGNHRIRKVSNGVISTVAGNGILGSSGDNGPAVDARLPYVNSIAVDSAGALYIADDGPPARIRKVSDGVITTIAGGGSENADGVKATDARLLSPRVAVDSAGTLYIAVSWEPAKVRKVTNGVITTVAGGGLDQGDGLPATEVRLGAEITALAVDSAGSIYFWDSGSDDPPNSDYRIRKVANGVISTIAGGGKPGGEPGDHVPATSAWIEVANALAVDSAGNLYIAEDYALVRKVSNGVITTVAGGGAAVGDDGPAEKAQLSPAGVAVDSAGNLYIADVGSIRKVSGGVISTVAGGGAERGDDVPATSASIYPGGVAVDSAGDLYFFEGERIRKVSNGVISTVAGGGAERGDGIVATSARLTTPCGFAVDSSGNIYISESPLNRVRKVSNGMITTVAGGGAERGDNISATSAMLSFACELAVDPAGNLYVADQNAATVRKVSDGVITTVAGNGRQGSSGDNGPATSATLLVHRIAVDSAGSLYIVESFNPRIRKVTNGVITTIAGNGISGFSADNGPATMLGYISGISIDAAGNIFITENNRIRVLTPGDSERMK